MDPGFYLTGYSFDQSVWDLETNHRFACSQIDQKIHRYKGYYLESDIRRLWTHWFLEGMIDPYYLIEKYPNPLLIDVIKEVDKSLSPVFNNPNNIFWEKIKESISQALYKKIMQMKAGGTDRKAFTRNEKEILLAKEGPHPRCWICGDEFSREAIDIFKGNKYSQIKLPAYVDIFRPKGIKERHLKIEIDHVYPISKGGEHDFANFRLCCGWCNLNKKNYVSLYEVDGRPIRLKDGKITKNTSYRTCPQNFWVVRALGLTQRCECDGCQATTKTEPLFIALIEPNGAATPSNLSIVCEKHDPFYKNRFQLVSDVVFALQSK